LEQCFGSIEASSHLNWLIGLSELESRLVQHRLAEIDSLHLMVRGQPRQAQLVQLVQVPRNQE